MINTESLDKMKRMRLLGMHRAFKNSLETKSSGNVTPDEMVAMLVESEWDERYNRSIERGLRNAHFRYKATIENIDYAPERGLDKNQVHRLADAEFVKKGEDLLITGSTGTGKSFLAS